MRILFLSRWYPYPIDNGAKIRIFYLLKYLAKEHDVDLLAFSDEPVDARRREALLAHCQEVRVFPYKKFEPTTLKALTGYFSKVPRAYLDTYSPQVDVAVRHLAQKHPYDVVVASQIDMALYGLLVPDAVKIFEEIEITTIYDRYSKQTGKLARFRAGLTWRKLSHFIDYLLGQYQASTVVSENEAELVRSVLTKDHPIAVIPNGFEVDKHIGQSVTKEPFSMIYSGALSYSANFDAVAYFLAEIFPLIRREYPQAKLYVTGKLDGVPVEQLPQQDGVEFTGYVEDIQSKVAESMVCVVPLRVGGGTRLKVLEALALETPIVSTTKGVEGLEASDGKEVLISDDPQGFAHAVGRLFDDRELYEKLARNGRSLVEAHYNWEYIGEQLNNFIGEVAK
ncbi:MAG: glycosyltransferase [Anaerolineales bacterium]|nr:glycosyltransferase [Anaerolineales bacterium]